MSKCEWCGKIAELEQYKDAIGDVHKVCKSCKTKVDNHKCRKCGTLVDPNMMIDGLCTNCIQVKMRDKSRKREEARLGVDSEPFTSEMRLTDEDYEKWLTFEPSYSPKDMKESKELRRLWILVKLNAAGIYDNQLISKNFTNIEMLLDRNFSKLVNNKCKITIDRNSETRKVIRNSEIIDYEDCVYILKA